MLHPTIGDEDPNGREWSTKGHNPCWCKMKSLSNLIPSKEKNSKKSGLKKKCRQSLNNKRCSKYISDKPWIVGPVSSKFEFEDDSCCHSYSKVNSKNLGPKLCNFFPKFISGTIIYRFHRRNDKSDTKSQWYKNPMKPCSKCKLCTRPVYETQEFKHRKMDKKIKIFAYYLCSWRISFPTCSARSVSVLKLLFKKFGNK